MTQKDGRYLLDTNIVIALFAEDEQVKDKCLQNEIEIYLPVIAIGELFFGVRKSKYFTKNIHQIEEFLRAVTVLSCDESTARYYGEIKQDLKHRGTPIPDNDIWIAAIAKQYDLVLVSRDSHFSHVTNIVVEKWLAHQP